ncbi:MAG: ABC-type transport auxiliary lipoprotein component [Rhodocyclales bacterium]|nr:ABC-type transport auxiliary lipoprotein component [Rhodocyclales bacterium]
MNKILIAASTSLLAMLSACSLPGAAPTVTQHDLGGMFPVASVKSPVPLRSIQVGAQPLVATPAMQYREASQPTRRGTYALNRWAATPASMLDAALVRQLAPDGSGRCRLQYSLGEFLIDVDADGKARAILAADASLLRDAVISPGGSVPASMARQSFDISVPMREASPAAGALALREAAHKLAEGTAAWLAGDAGRMCAI